MAVDERLIEILRCPDCGGKVEYKERRKVLVCFDCGLQYPVKDGIAVMLVDQARPSRGRAS